MHYTKLFFLSASLLAISSGVFAADVPEKKSQVLIQRLGAPFAMVSYSRKEPISELIKDYKKQAGIPDEVNVELLIDAKPLDENVPAGSYALDVEKVFAKKKPAVAAQTPVKPSIMPSPSAMSSSMQPATTIREVAPQWFEAKSKTTYFRDKYKKLEPRVGFVHSDYDGYIEFKKDPVYDYLRDTIMSKIDKSKSYIVIRAMLENAASESSMDYQLLTKLVQPATVRAIAALQKLYGKGKKIGFQFDEYNKTQLQAYLPVQIDPFIARVSPGIDMTIYRFLHNVIGELDDVPVVKDSPLYKILDTFDNSLTEIIRQ